MRGWKIAGVFVGLVAAASLVAGPTVEPVTQEALMSRLGSGATAPFVLDVRSPEEFASGHVPGAVNIPHDQIAARLAEVPRDKDVVLYCRSGRRTMLAAEVLAGNGYTRLQHLEGDAAAWVDQGRPLEKPRDPDACVKALKSGAPAAQACAPN